MNNPLLDHSYYGLPDEGPEGMGGIPKSNEEYEQLLIVCRSEIERYQQELEKLTQSQHHGVASIETASNSTITEQKSQISRMSVQIQTLLQQNENLRSENHKLTVELQSRPVIKQQQQHETPPSMDFHDIIDRISKDLRSISFDNRLADVENNIRKLNNQFVTNPRLGQLEVTAFVDGLWRQFKTVVSDYPEDNRKLVESQQQDIASLKSRIANLNAASASQPRQAAAPIPPVRFDFAEPEFEQRQNTREHYIDELESEISRKNQVQSLVSKMRVMMANVDVDRNDLAAVMGKLAKLVDNTADVQKLLSTIKSSYHADADDNDEENEADANGGVGDQIRHLTDVIDEHIEVAAKLKKENRHLMEEVEMFEEKLELREAAWLEKYKEIESMLDDIRDEKKQSSQVLLEYETQYSQFITLLPNKQELADKPVTHPIPFIKHAETLHSINQASLHALDHLKQAKERMQQELKHEKMKRELILSDFQVVQHRVKQSENDRLAIDANLNGLQQSLSELTHQLEEVTEERDMLESKLLRVGEGFFRTIGC